MYRLGAHDSDDIFFAVYDHTLCRERLGVEASDRLYPDEALIIYGLDHKSDLIHVRGGHHFFLAAFAFHERDEVSHVICIQF